LTSPFLETIVNFSHENFSKGRTPMDINNIQGMNAYTAGARMADTASVRNINKDATEIEPDKASPRITQEAFQVDITREALALQTENTEAPAKENREQQLPVQTQQPQVRQGIQLDVIA